MTTHDVIKHRLEIRNASLMVHACYMVWYNAAYIILVEQLRGL